MNATKNVSLKPYNTFGIDVSSKQFCSISTVEELKEVISTHPKDELFILGGGSNILLTRDVNALVLHINIKGITIISETENTITVEVSAGENWHEFVLFCIDNNYGGVENLSLIPGNVGTAPMQNIGAYGVELKDVFESCKALDIASLEEKTFNKEDCNFGYRESVFKRQLKSKYILTSVRFRLTKKDHKLNVDYGAIRDELSKMNVNNPTIKDISNAVIAIRQSKLPDPKEIGNSGSFFKNPVVSVEKFNQLKSNFPNIPSYKISDQEVKVPAGWLIETAGFKGKTFGNYGVHKKQALVLVNYGGADGQDIYNLAKLIKKTVFRLFNIEIETEVNIL
ncbi:UDP-N-acetylmuramate dehydrogenase [Winogradskyella sp. A3E31]|uniref:UDP-N-acetylmuramate dehydrogenase n=1 Tax=Winogradskyella sp. A3E31 TaxID=3349637 RepID=UPI00398B1EAB